MEFYTVLLCLFLSSTLIRFFLSTVNKGKKAARKHPPGPVPLPIVGDLFRLGERPHRSLAQLAATHGPLMTLKLGSVTTVVASSSAMAKEVLMHNDLPLSSRTVMDAACVDEHEKCSMIWLSVTPLWKNFRKACHSNIFVTKSLDAKQEIRRRKVQELVAFFRRKGEAGEAVDIGEGMFVNNFNLLSHTLFSQDLLSLGSEKGQEFRHLMLGYMEEFAKFNVADYFPILRKMDVHGIKRRSTLHIRKMFQVFDEIIHRRLISRKAPHYSLTRSDGDVLDVLLDISEESKSDNITLTHIKHLFVDLFVGATDTTSVALEWGMAELLRNPSIMRKARDEIERVIGKDKPFEESDISQLPYLHAIVKETLRLHPPAPLLMPHKAAEDVQICGYTVPKHAQVFVNAWLIGRDPSTWASPEEFRPERFLGSDIEVKSVNFELAPFSGGRRSCPGYPLALRMLHLTLGSLIQSFDWQLEGGIAPEDMDMGEHFGLNLRKALPLRAVPTPV